MKYFDYTATTPVDKDVLDTYVKTTNNFFANTTSLHSLGQRSNMMYEKAKHELLDLMGLKNHEVIFTSNATEANNLAILGLTGKYNNGRIITTKIEHASVFEPINAISDKFDVVYIDIDEFGQINLEQLKNALNNDTILVSIMWVNNIIGAVEPIEDVIKLLKQYPKAKLHVDCVQGMCKVNPKFDFNDVDMFTFSTHKIYGPKGIGGLFIKNNIALHKVIYGSNSQMGLKPGTLDLSLIVSTVKAFKKFYPLTTLHLKDVKEKYNYLRNKINNKHIIFNTNGDNISYYILNLSIPGINGETIVHMLESKEIYVSTGSACSSKLKKPERTVLALTHDEKRATSLVRISLSFLTTYSELDDLISVLNKIGE